jgi:putative NIF3 family GTP cyclohydrolase 1 type 2
VGSKSIQRIAVLGGSGSFAIRAAKRRGADAYITADLKYHDFFEGNSSFLLVDAGHYETEQHTKKLIVDYLTKKLPNFAILLSEVETNPINYF